MPVITVKEVDVSISSEEVLQDYRLAYKSREASLVGRREVLSGKAKFGIFGDGKEIAQLAMAKAFRKGDIRSGYYRDQTFMFATGMSGIKEFFAQMYSNTDTTKDPASSGRQMNAHFATHSLNDDGSWKNLSEQYNSSADVSPTASQMPRLVGLAYASRLYREVEDLHYLSQFSKGGNEIAFGTIGNASCAEGMFWEAVNAVGVLRAPMLLSIWDDGYGISVPNKYQITKQDLSELLSGFQRLPDAEDGFDVYTVAGWDYPALVKTYLKAAEQIRKTHIPAIIHVVEVTQPQGHSTSGSHERYKSKERLQWEEEHDCLLRMRRWIVEKGIAGEEELDALEKADKKQVRELKKQAWEEFIEPVLLDVVHTREILDNLVRHSSHGSAVEKVRSGLLSIREPLRKDIAEHIDEALFAVRNEHTPQRDKLLAWKREFNAVNQERYSSHLHCETGKSALRVPEIKAHYSDASETIVANQILNRCFDEALKRDPRIFAFGEDVGQLGDVNQGFAGLQEIYGELRVADTGIRECTIIGQAIGMAMRGLRPIAEIQYLDYVLYALQIMSDDLATVSYRTRGYQKAPVIIRTRGHRLEGIWHSGSPMAGIINLVRGMHVLVPRNMTQAAGFYNTMLQADDPCLIVEVLNGYRLKEVCPDNIDQFTIPVGVPEIVREGRDITLVTYGATCRIVEAAAEKLALTGIEAEVVDVRSLLPFDIHGMIGASLKKTNRILFVDEDVPGGTTAFMMQKVLEEQQGYRWLDSAPRSLAAREHRPAYGSDGNHWSKPTIDDVFESVYAMMHEAEPGRFPIFFR